MNHTVPDLTKITELFLLANSFLVTAVGTADTNYHKTGVSLIGLTVSILWSISSREALAEFLASQPAAASSRRVRVISSIANVFIAIWCISAIGHLLLAWHVISI